MRGYTQLTQEERYQFMPERPAIVDAKRRFGDREGGTVIGKGHQGALVTLVERKSLYTVIRPVLRKRQRLSETLS